MSDNDELNRLCDALASVHETYLENDRALEILHDENRLLRKTLQSILTRAGPNADVSGVVPPGWIKETLKMARGALEKER